MQLVPKVFVGGPIQYAIRTFKVAERSSEVCFDRDLKSSIETMITLYEDLGLEILSAHRFEHYGSMDVTNEAASVARRDFRWMTECDLFTAVVPLKLNGKPYRSDGTCVELGWASALGKPVVLVTGDLRSYSHLVAGLDNVTTVSVVDSAELQDRAALAARLSQFLATLGLSIETRPPLLNVSMAST